MSLFRPEILAPAGNLFKLKTAVRYGADAVYIAGRHFGLRSAAQNFTQTEIVQACAFAHRHGAKVYVVLNGFLFDEEVARLPPFLKELEQAQVDAVIVSDLGVVETVAAHSNIPIHLSTQASTLNSECARFWKDRGVCRIVLGREVSIEQAGKIKREAGIEVELFIHGAMCMAFSGNCTISNYTAGRDSNRGGCVQSCRFHYQMGETRGGPGEDGYFFSSKDLNGLALMERFVAEEIDSLKIEGRMKSALYVATTARTYKQVRDRVVAGDTLPNFQEPINELNAMSHRDYTQANLVAPAGAESTYTRDDRDIPPSHDILGHVLEARPDQYTAVFLKNPINSGEQVNFLGLDGHNYNLATHQMKTLDGQTLERGNPNRVVLFPYHPEARADLILRKAKHAVSVA